MKKFRKLIAISLLFLSFGGTITPILSKTAYADATSATNKADIYLNPENFINTLSKTGKDSEYLLNEYKKLTYEQQIEFLKRLKEGKFDVEVVEEPSFGFRSVPIHGSHYKTYTHKYYLFGINLLDFKVEVHFDYQWHRATKIHYSKSYVSHFIYPFSDLYQSSHYAYIDDGRVYIKSAFTMRYGLHINGIGIYVTPRTFYLDTVAEGNGRIYGSQR